MREKSREEKRSRRGRRGRKGRRRRRKSMGRVRTKTVKKSSRQVIERYYSRMTLDFHTNKKLLEEVAIIPSKRLRNKIAGFSTHLMKRIQKGPVRGISLKLQEEERERRMDFVPDVSAINTEHIAVDKETLEMLHSLGINDIPGITQVDPVPVQHNFPFTRRYWSIGHHTSECRFCFSFMLFVLCFCCFKSDSLQTFFDYIKLYTFCSCKFCLCFSVFAVSFN